MINRIKDIWNKYNLDFYGYVAGSFFMGTIHLVTICISFSWLVFNYMLFCYIMMSIRLLIWFAGKRGNEKNIYLIGAVSLLAIIIPLTVSLVRTIMDREYSPFVFEWFIYAYALFAFAKLAFGIVKLVKAHGKGNSTIVLGWFTIVDALFTMFMLEFTMIRAFSTVRDGAIFVIEYLFQGFIIAFTAFISGMFLKRYKNLQKELNK